MIEARIKLPFGLGVWPAFWMLGEDINTDPWPGCGEVDIMENFGTFNNNTSINNGTAHGPGYSGGSGITAAITLPFGETVYDDYHVYALLWSPNSVQFFVDGVSYSTVTPSSIPPGDQWVFNAPFFILLNLAIGGSSTFLGTPDPSAPFPNQDLVVDWVRVYQSVSATSQTPVITPGSVVNAASYLGTVAPGALAVLYGTNLADNTYQNVIDASGNFVKTLAGVTVTVDGVAAPLVYLSPTQINFQIPWETVPGTAVSVQVTRNTVLSAVETITIANSAAPSMFLEDFHQWHRVDDRARMCDDAMYGADQRGLSALGQRTRTEERAGARWGAGGIHWRIARPAASGRRSDILPANDRRRARNGRLLRRGAWGDHRSVELHLSRRRAHAASHLWRRLLTDQRSYWPLPRARAGTVVSP